MLPRARRVRKTAFNELLNRGSYGASPFFSIRFTKSGQSGVGADVGITTTFSTFAVVVSKKVAASAVARNKIKRKCYHALRDLLPKIKNSYKIVFFAKKGVEKLSFKELSDNVYSTLSKSGLLN